MPLYFCGARHLVTYPVMPLGEKIALSIAIVSLGGVMGFGFTGDREAMSDIRRLAAHVEAAFGALRRAAGSAPAGTATAVSRRGRPGREVPQMNGTKDPIRATVRRGPLSKDENRAGPVGWPLWLDTEVPL